MLAKSATFNAEATLTAIKDEGTLAQLATRSDVHPNQIIQWKNLLLERAADALNGWGQAAEVDPGIKSLHAKIHQLALENDFSRRALMVSRIEHQAMRNSDHGLGLTR